MTRKNLLSMKAKSKAIVKRQPKQNGLVFTPETIELIKTTVAVGATDDELKMFLYQARRTGLDPLARQIYFIKRKSFNKESGQWVEKANIQASIDGLRVVAQRSKTYAGQDEPKFEEGTAGSPTKCTVTVYRFNPTTAERYPAGVGVAYWAEYVPQQGQDFMWRKMPHTMLAKVAEALAIRKAFPQDLSGIYSEEEMAQALPKVEAPKAQQALIPAEENKVVEVADSEAVTPITNGQMILIKKLIDSKKIEFNPTDIGKLSFDEARKIIQES